MEEKSTIREEGDFMMRNSLFWKAVIYLLKVVYYSSAMEKSGCLSMWLWTQMALVTQLQEIMLVCKVMFLHLWLIMILRQAKNNATSDIYLRTTSPNEPSSLIVILSSQTHIQK